MERIIAQNRDEIMHIIRTSKNTQSACSQIQRQFEVGYIKAKQIINYLSMSPLQIQSQSSMFNDLIKIPEGFEYLSQYFIARVNAGAELRYGLERVSCDNALHDRIEHEVKQIYDLRFESYFLFIADLLHETFEKMNIYHGPGRSSVAGSVVAYCLGITDVDPLKYGLLFERFINPIGVSKVQIDIDVEYDERLRIVDYLKQKYGEDQLAHLIDLDLLAQKSAIIKVGKGLTFDIIGLCILTVIKECLKKIEHKYGIDDMKSIINPPKDDEKTFRLFQEGNTKGVFLFESDSMRKNLKRLQPSTFEELVALNAICRPKQMDLMTKYIKRKHNLEAITYYHPVMEKYLKETYGVIIYQEQIMLLSQEIAHFTPAESDVLARGVCCRRMTSAEVTLKEKFINGGVENGFDKDILEIIWSDWMKNGCYLSNKSHAVCYTWFAYKIAYLKAHYLEEFLQSYSTVKNREIE